MALPLLGKKIVKKNGQEIQENPERPLCFSQGIFVWCFGDLTQRLFDRDLKIIFCSVCGLKCAGLKAILK